MTPQELKTSILLLALKGKIVDQIPEEGTGEDLFFNIKKSHIIKKKIASFSDIPYDIPDTWKWCPLNELANIVVGATPSTANASFWNNGTIPWLPSGCCRDSIVTKDFPQIKYITQSGYDSCSTKMMKSSTVVIALTGATTGKVGLLDFEACGNQSVVGIEPFEGLDPKYVFYTLMGRRNEIIGDCFGSAQPHISKEYITKMLFALPPLKEQKRIVQKIESILPLIDEYKIAWEKLEHFNKEFPTELEKSILQYAIKGKLVEQRVEDGDASDLLTQIRKEKKSLMDNKIIKKENPYLDVSEDEQLFDIPDNWAWCRLGDLGGWQSGSTPSKSEPKYYENGTIPWLVTGDLNNDYLDDVPGRITELALKETSVKLNPAGSVLIAMYGATIGKTAIINFPCTTNQACCACVHVASIDKKYLFYYLLAQRDYFIGRGEGGAQPNISREKIVATPFALPPLNEQKRIVSKIDELLSLCRKLVK